MSGGSAAPASRRARAVESFASAAEAIGPVERGMSVFTITRGQWSMVDAVQHLVAEVVARSQQPAHLSLWTWTVASYETDVMAALMANTQIVGATLVIDRSAEVRAAETIQGWRDRFGSTSVKTVKNHSKVARIWTDDYHLLLRGSCNLNWNPRFENVDLTEGGEDFNLVQRIEDELPVLRPMCSNAEAEAASKLSLAFEASELAMFSGVKPWSIGTRAK